MPAILTGVTLDETSSHVDYSLSQPDDFWWLVDFVEKRGGGDHERHRHHNGPDHGCHDGHDSDSEYCTSTPEVAETAATTASPTNPSSTGTGAPTSAKPDQTSAPQTSNSTTSKPGSTTAIIVSTTLIVSALLLVLAFVLFSRWRKRHRTAPSAEFIRHEKRIRSFRKSIRKSFSLRRSATGGGASGGGGEFSKIPSRLDSLGPAPPPMAYIHEKGRPLLV